jgi:hypothetical protein
MARWEQFEVWARAGDRWELVAAFADFQVAQAVAHNRHTGVRLVHAVIEDGKEVQRDTLAEIGGAATREHPDKPA